MNPLETIIKECAEDAAKWYPNFGFFYWYDPIKNTYELRVWETKKPSLLTKRTHHAEDIAKKDSARMFVSNEYREIAESIAGVSLMQPDLNEEIVAADDAIDAKEDDDPVSSEPSMKDVDLEAENVTSFSETKRLGQLEIKKEVTLDNWRHRSAKMKCCTCMWFVKKDMIVETLDDKHIGRCRKHAPTMDGFPVVFELDWCGDHKLDETKINVEIG